MSRLRAIGLLVLLASSGLAWAAQGAGAAPFPWWGPTTVGQGFHIRVPVTVTNSHSVPLDGAPAIAQLDVTQLLKDSGWVSAPRGDRDILQSFALDLDSIRVVAMENLNPNGQMRPVDLTYPASDPRRFEVPSMALPGFLDRPQAEPFNPQTNPLVTVVWEVDGTLAPGAKRHYIIYLDSTTNIDHPPPDYRGKPAWGHLQSLFWSAPGLELVGFAQPGANGYATLTVVGLHDDTRVQAYRHLGGSQWAPLVSPSGFPAYPVPLRKDQSLALFAGTDTTLVRLVATKPILGYKLETGFVPSLDAGMIGRSFLLAMATPPVVNGVDDTIHFVAVTTAPTTVVVQPVPPTGQTFTFQMNGGPNPNNYTVGARGGTFSRPNAGCQPPVGGPPSPLLPGPGLYRAQVTQGGPVLLQHSPNYGLFQVPSDDGSPTGAALHAATGWSNFGVLGPGRPNASCSAAHRVGSWFAAGLDGLAGMRVTSPDAGGIQVDPAGTQSIPIPPPRPIPAAPQVSGPHPAPLRDRPLQFTSAGEEVALYAGLFPMAFSSSRFPVHGPWGGGDMGRRFAGSGATVLYAPYDNTVVQATVELGSGTIVRDILLGAGEVRLLSDAVGAEVVGFRLESNRPLIAYPLSVNPGTLASLPVFLAAEPVTDKVSFRGRMVDVATASGLDPLTGSTIAGRALTHTLTVTNLGRDASGAPLGDTIDLSVVPTHLPGWTATLDRSSIPLAGGASHEIHLTVRPAADVPPGSVGAFQVKVASHENPAVTDSLGTVTYLQRSYDVGLWFGSVNGAKTLQRTVEADHSTDYTLVVQNQGSVQDTIALASTPPAEGWSAQILQAGVPVRSLLLDPSADATLTLRVAPPPGAADGILTTFVTATGSGQATDQVIATTRLKAPSDLELEVGREQVLVLPGGEALFPLVLHNEGVGTADVAFEVSADVRRGWVLSGAFSVQEAARTNLTQVSVEGGQKLPFTVGVRAAAAAPAGQTVGLRVLARTSDGMDRAEAFLWAVVRPHHRLEATVPPQPLASETGFDGSAIPVRISNLGNLDERLTLRVRDLPPGWSLGAPAQLFLLRNATQALTLNLTTPAGHPPGTYNLTLDLVSRDGNATAIRLAVALGAAARGNAGEASLAVLAQPGRAARVAVPVRNDGNIPLEVRVRPAAGEPWRLAPGPPLLLPPGANASLEVAWEVPPGAADGATRHTAQVALAGPDGAPAVQDVGATVLVGRAELAPSGFRAYPGAAGTLLEGIVRNTGSRAAPSFIVRLMAGQDAVENLVVESLPAGGNATVRLMLPLGLESPTVVVDAESAVVEADERNNVASLADPSVQSPAGVLGALAALGVALALQRRRT